MEETSAEDNFVSNFYSLTGTTVGERRKNLFLLLRTTRQCTAESNIDFSAVAPRTPLEENFKVEALIYFRRVPELLQVLKDGNPILIQKVLNVSSWFVKAAFNNMSGEELAENYFPYFSLKTKLKLLNKLSLHLQDPGKAEKFFEAIKKKYGLYLASTLFPACSFPFIIKLFVSNRIEVTPGQLLRVAKAHPRLIGIILKSPGLRSYDTKLSIKYENVFRYLLQTNVKRFDRIQEEFAPEIILGARATRSFVRKHKENFMQDPNKFYCYLLRKQLGKSLKEDFEVFYTNIFPKSMKYFSDNLGEHMDLLRHIPSDSKKLELLLRVFKKRFGKELWECPTVVTSKLIEMMSPDDREVWMQTHKKPENIAEAQWISYMKTEKSLPLLKESISHTSVERNRASLISCLVRTCLMNDDKLALLDVCKHVANKHRNDNAVLGEFMNTLYYSKFISKLDSEHWKYIIDLVRIAKLKGNEEWVSKATFNKYIHFCLNNQLPVRELLVECTKYKYATYNLTCKNSSHEKKCLMIFADIIQNYSEDVTEEHLKSMHMNFLLALTRWNKRFPKDKLSLFMNDGSIEYLKSNLKVKEYADIELELVLKCIKFDHEKSEDANLPELFFKFRNTSRRLSRNMINLLLKYHPSLFLKHMRVIADKDKHFINCRNRLNSDLYRYYSHMGIPRGISGFLQQQANKDVNRKWAILVLSHLMEPDAFINEIAKHYPANLTADISTPEKQEKYKYQKAFMPCLKNVIPPSHALHPVLEFCKGDYLNAVQPSLYSLCMSVPENELSSFYSTLLDRAVSVKKNAICLAFNTLNVASIKQLTEKLVSEGHPSIRKILCKATFDHFMKNPSKGMWEMTKTCMEAADFKDKEVVEILRRRDWILYSYFDQYVLLAWAECEKHETLEGKEYILESINSQNILTVPAEFSENVFQRYLFKSKKLSSFDMKLHSFACKYMIYCSLDEKRNKRIELILGNLKAYVQSNQNNVATSLACRQCSVNFVKEFCAEFLNKKCHKQNILEEVIAQWSTAFEPHEALFEYLYLQFTLLYLRRLETKLDIPQMAEHLVQLYNNVADSTLATITVFCECFDMFKEQLLVVEKHERQEENFYNLLDTIINTDTSQNILMLIISLLPTENVVMPDFKCTYDKIMEILLNQQSRSIQVHLNHYLNKLPLQLEQKPSVNPQRPHFWSSGF